MLPPPQEGGRLDRQAAPRLVDWTHDGSPAARRLRDRATHRGGRHLEVVPDRPQSTGGRCPRRGVSARESRRVRRDRRSERLRQVDPPLLPLLARSAHLRGRPHRGHSRRWPPPGRARPLPAGHAGLRVPAVQPHPLAERAGERGARRPARPTPGRRRPRRPGARRGRTGGPGTAHSWPPVGRSAAARRDRPGAGGRSGGRLRRRADRLSRRCGRSPRAGTAALTGVRGALGGDGDTRPRRGDPRRPRPRTQDGRIHAEITTPTRPAILAALDAATSTGVAEVDA